MSGRSSPHASRTALGLGLGTALLALLAACPSLVWAFSDPLSFTDPVDVGGGGGRWFTGSAADGYGCGVCHAGATPPQVTLVGLPLSGYEPATSYEIRVEWSPSIEHVSLALEIADSHGAMAGALYLPPDGELMPEESCEPVDGELFGAAALYELDNRTVLSVPDCGAQRARFLWMAPKTAQGPLRLSGGIVASDGKQDAEGDGALSFARVLPLADSAQTATPEVRGTTCGLQPAPNHASTRWLASCLVALALCGYRTRRRR